MIVQGIIEFVGQVLEIDKYSLVSSTMRVIRVRVM